MIRRLGEEMPMGLKLGSVEQLRQLGRVEQLSNYHTSRGRECFK